MQEEAGPLNRWSQRAHLGLSSLAEQCGPLAGQQGKLVWSLDGSEEWPLQLPPQAAALPPPCVCVRGAWREKESALERKPGIQCGHKVLSKSSGSSKKEKCASRD